MKKLTRIISLLCVLALLATLIPAPAFAASSNDKFFPRYTGSSGSLVDGLKAVGAQSSYSYRCRIAAVAGINGYQGSASDNTYLLGLLKAGQLPNPDYIEKNNSSSSSTSNSFNHYFPRYTGSSGSLVDGLKAVGAQSSYSYRCRIAAAAGINGYQGSASDNTYLLRLLKAGQLKKPDANATSSPSTSSPSTSSPSTSISHKETAQSFAVYEAAVNTTVRAEPYEASKVLSNINSGTLVRRIRTVTNKYGNIWIETVDPSSGQTGYIYSGKLNIHNCTFTSVDGYDVLKYCRCGAFVEQKNGTTGVSYAAALPNPITPDIVAELGALGLATSGALVAAAPYVAVAVVGGIVILIAISVSQGVTVQEVTTDWRKLDKDFRPDDGIYYNGIVKDNFIWIDVANPMDEYLAMLQIDKAVAAYTFNPCKDTLWFIYTVQDYDALNLASEYVESRSGYDFTYAVDCHGSKSMLNQFKHYHITSIFNHYYHPDDGYEAHYGGHIAFGTPAHDTLWGQGAWF